MEPIKGSDKVKPSMPPGTAKSDRKTTLREVLSCGGKLNHSSIGYGCEALKRERGEIIDVT
jgi:hypothetical protein